METEYELKIKQRHNNYVEYYEKVNPHKTLYTFGINGHD